MEDLLVNIKMLYKKSLVVCHALKVCCTVATPSGRIGNCK